MSQDSRVAKAAIIVMVGFLGAKITGLARQLVIADAFGTIPALDAYNAAFTTPDIIFTLISGGALATAFIPIFSEYLNRKSGGGTVEREVAWRMASNVLTVTFSLACLVSIIVALLAPFIVRQIVAPGFTPELQAITVHLMRLVLLSTIIFSVSGLVQGVLHTLQHFLLPAFAPLVYNLGIILGALVIAPRMPAGQEIYGLVWGSIVGASFHLAIQVPALVRHGVRLRPLIDLRDEGLRQVAILMGPRAAALALINGKLLIKSNMASRLDAGSLSALDYAYDLMQLPETIFATAVATAVFPTLSELFARKARQELARTFNRTRRAILTLTVPAAVGLLILGLPIVRAFYERGRFDLESSQAVSYGLAFYAFGIVGHGLLELYARLFYAQKDTIRPLYAAAVMLFVTGLLSWLLIEPLHLGGIALADTVGVFVEVGLLAWWLRSRLPELNREVLRPAILKVGSASTLMALALLAWLQLTGDQSVYLVAGGGILLGGAVYGTVALLLGLEEIKMVPRMILRRVA